jgi:hypothetical protein
MYMRQASKPMSHHRIDSDLASYNVCMCMYVHMHICIYIYMCVCVCVHACRLMYVCMYEYAGWFNINFNRSEDMLYDHKQEINAKIYWSRNVYILIYSTLKLIRGANLLDRTDRSYT